MNAEIQIQNNNNFSASAGGGGIIVRNRNNSSQSNVSMELEAFLATRKRVKPTPYTHSRIGDRKTGVFGGSWVILPEDLPEFHRLYYAKIGTGAEDYLVEKQTGNALYIDLDFKYLVGTTDKQHTLQHTYALIEKVIEVCISKYGFGLQIGDAFLVFVMEKQQVNADATWKVNGEDEPVVKDGIHIQFGFKIPQWLLPQLYKDILAELEGGLLDLPVINTWADILDKGVFEQSTNNQMYGSVKAKGAKRYSLIKTYYFRMEEDGLNPEEPDPFRVCAESFHYISTNCAENVQPHWIEEEVVVPVPVRVARASVLAGGAIGSDAESVATSNAPIGDSSPEQYDCVAEYIREGLLSRYVTSGQYKEWVNLGYALYASFGQVRGLVLWKLLSVERETDPAIGNRPDAQWAKICGSFNTIATGVNAIHAKAKSTNAKKQRVIWVKNIGAKKNLYGSMWSSGMIADYFKDLHKEFVFSQDNLYFFTGVIWEKCDKMCSQLHCFVDKVFVPELREYGLNRLQHFHSQSEDATDEAQRQIISKNIEMVLKFQSNLEGLRDVKKRKSLIEDIRAFVVQPNIDWDNKDYLFAFNNRIFDLSTGEVVEGNPLHYMSMTAGWNYEDNYPLDERKAELSALLDDMFRGQPAVKDDFLMYLSTGLSGLHQQFIHINTGKGANGKSVITDLMTSLCGTYSKVFNPALFSKDMKDGANPEFWAFNKLRFAVFSEPNSRSKLVVSVIKPITGDNAIQVRNGHDFSGTPCVLKCSLMGNCNDVPNWDDLTAYSTIRRLRMSHWKTIALNEIEWEQAVEKGEDMSVYGHKNEYFITEEWKTKYRQALFHILLDYFQRFVAFGGMPPQPKECEVFKSDYLAGGDEVFVWLEAKFEKCDKKIPLSLTDIFKEYEMSSLYQCLPVSQKRLMNRKSFVANLQKNTNISPFVYIKGKSFNGKQIKADCLLGWKKRAIDPLTGMPVEEAEVFFEEDESCCSAGGGGY